MFIESTNQWLSSLLIAYLNSRLFLSLKFCGLKGNVYPVQILFSIVKYVQKYFKMCPSTSEKRTLNILGTEKAFWFYTI